MSHVNDQTAHQQQRAPTANELLEMVYQLQGHISMLENRQHSRSVKMRAPETFDGNQTKLRSFITRTDMYLHMNRDKISTESDKVLFACTYLRGPAFNWFEPTVREFNDKPATQQTDNTREVFASYQTFKRRLEETFGDIDAARNAERKLQRLRHTSSASS